MEEQKITVNTKGGLLAAFECAKDYTGCTVIKLKRVTEETVFKLEPEKVNVNEKNYPYTSYWDQAAWNKIINKAKAKIKRISAIDLLS